MTEQTHFEKVADYVMNNDGSELSMVKAERDYALHCLEREIAIAQQAQERVEALEAALRKIVNGDENGRMIGVARMYGIARAALEQEK